jgi:hypothetical protein
MNYLGNMDETGMVINKRSQLTLFFILGIIILILFMLMLSFGSQSTEDKFMETQHTLISETLKSQDVNQLVTQCLHMKSLSAIRKILLQGGFFFMEQEGSIITWDVESVNVTMGDLNVSVAYQIHEPLDTIVSGPPYYPCYVDAVYTANIPNSMKGQQCHETFTSRVKNLKLGMLNEELGNRVRPPLLKEPVRIGNLSYGIYEYLDTQYRYSIQEQLEKYIEAHISECITFEHIKGYNESFKADIKNTSIEIFFGHNGIVVNLYLPVTYSVGRQTTSSIQKFKYSVTLPIRFKQMYELFRKIIQKEVSDASFDTNEYEMRTFDIYRTVLPNYDTLIIINDTMSRINGQEVVFQFASKNRAPVLDHLGEGNPPNPFPEDCDYFVVENNTLRIEPFAVDPDENEIFYSYHGWKVDWDDIYDEDTNTVNKIPYGGPNLWHDSNIYIDTKRVAEIVVSHSDVGMHELIVNVSDGNGYYDYQVVKIKVDDKPTPKITKGNPYIDVPSGITSIEDPYIINASETYSVDTEAILEYKWLVDGGGFLSTDWTKLENILYIPYSGPPFDIHGMKGGPNGYFNVVGDHNIIYSVRKLGILESTETKTIPIQVELCLPHRDASAPWPFNMIRDDLGSLRDDYPYNKDPFDANHTCCKSDYTYAPDSTVCYSLIDYGCRSDFENTWSAYYDPGNLKTHDPSKFRPPAILNDVDDLRNNDVYEREFKKNCDGMRGNTCTGDVTVHSVRPVDYGADDGIKNCFDDLHDSVCNHCMYGMDSCYNETVQSNTACNSKIKCVGGPGATYVNTPGYSWACTGSCDGHGRCMRANPDSCIDCSAQGKVCVENIGCQ